MGRSWYWVLLIFCGSLTLAGAMQSYLAGETAVNTSANNWLTAGQGALGLLMIAFGLYRQIAANRHPVPQEPDARLNLHD